MMQLPKMTKAHRMYLYGVLTTGIVALVVAGLTSVIFVFHGGSSGTDPMDVIRNSPKPELTVLPPQPGQIVGDLPKTKTSGVSGWVTKADGDSIVIDTAKGERLVRVTNKTVIHLLNAADIDPTKYVEIKSADVPRDALAHVTYEKGVKDTAIFIVVVKNHD